MKTEGLEQWQYKQDIDPVPCPQCGNESDDNQVMGALGRRVWIRCGACGWEYSYLIGEKRASGWTKFEDEK